MPTEVLDIAVVAKIDKLRSELEKIPGITAKESKKMAAVWSRDFKRAERSAERARKQMAREAEQVRDAWKDSSERMASLLGGTFGDISDSILDLGSRFGELSERIGGAGGAMVLAGGAFTAGAFAIGFAGAALVEFMSDAEETIEALEGFAGLEGLTAQQVADVHAYTEAMTDLEGVTTSAKAQMQSGLAPALTSATHAVIGLQVAVDDAESSTGVFTQAYDNFIFSVRSGSPHLAYLYDLLVERGEEAAQSIDKLTDAQKEANRVLAEGSDEIRQTTEDLNAMAEALGYQRESYVDVDKAAKEAEERQKAAAKAAREAAQEQARQAAEWERIWENAKKETAKRNAAEKAAAEERKKLIAEEQEAQEAMWAAASESWSQLSQEASEYALFLEEELIKGQQEAMVQLTDMTLELVEGAMQQRMDALVREENQSKRLHRQAQDQLKAEREHIEAQIESGKISESEGKSQIKRIDTEMRANAKARRQARRDHRAALLDAHKAQQAAAIARATIDAAANAVALTTAFAYLGTGAPIAAAGVAAAQLAIEKSVIKSTKPPKFAVGGMVRDRVEGDHVPVLAEPDEGILTRRGVEAAGGPAGVAALNAGTMSGGGHGSTRVYLDSRMLGEVVAMSVATDQRVTSALDRQTGAIPGQRR